MDALQDSLDALAVAVTLLGALPANLWFVALVGFVVSNLLTVVTLFWAVTAFENLGVSGFASPA